MGVKVVQLTSKSYHHNILVSLEQLRLQGHLSDVTVQVDHQGHSQEFQAHRVVLAASSGYFKNIFLSQDAAQNTVLLSDIHSDDFSKFLEFVYTGKIEIAQDKIVDVQTAAQFLDCVDLSEVCGEAMSAGILQKPLKKTSASKVADKDDSNSDKTGDGAKEKKQSEGLHPKRHLSPQSPERDVVSKRFKATRAENNEKSQSIEVKRRLAGRKVLKRRSNGKSEILNNETQVSNEDTEECEDRTKVKAQHENQAEKGEEISLGTAVPGEDEWTCEDDRHSNDPEDPSLLSHGDEEEEEKEEGEDGEQLKEMLKRTSKAQFQCNKCQRTFHYERSYLKHISTYHGVKADIVYRCETCQQTFANRSNLKIHEKHVHSSERLFSCESCMKTFKRKKDVVRHQRQVHERNNLNHVCPVCGKALSSKTALLLHERTHTGDKPFECTDCGSRFTQNSALKMHRRTHTGEKPFACDQCEARFTQKHMLDYHKRSHSGEKPFMCEACGKSFASKEYLRYHSNIHTGSKPFKCDKCGRGFAQRNSLNQHSKIHTGERPYVCKDCQKPFTQLNALQRHRRIHTGEKPYMCGLCSRTFTDKSTLRRHAMMHDSDAPWKTYLVVLEGNVEDKKPKSPAKGKTDKAGEKKGAARKSGGAAAADVTDGVPGKINTDSIMVPAEPVTLASDWTSHGITLVSHSGITVIHTEVPAGAQIQPIMTTDSTGTSVISLDGSTIPFSIPVSMAHPIPLSSDASSTSLSVPSVLSVPATEIATVSTSSVLETAASQTILVPDSDPKTTSEIAIVHPNIETVIVGDKHCAKDQTAAVQSDGEKMAAQNISNETKVASDQEAV